MLLAYFASFSFAHHHILFTLDSITDSVAVGLILADRIAGLLRLGRLVYRHKIGRHRSDMK